MVNFLWTSLGGRHISLLLDGLTFHGDCCGYSTSTEGGYGRMSCVQVLRGNKFVVLFSTECHLIRAFWNTTELEGGCGQGGYGLLIESRKKWANVVCLAFANNQP